jgi:hypothetical protein
MATVQKIVDGPNILIIKVDGAGSDSLVKIVDVATLVPTCAKVRLAEIVFQLAPAGTADLFWEASANLALLHMYGGNDCDMCFESSGGLPNNAGSGVTGNVLITTSANAYSMVMKFYKSKPNLPT